MNDPRRTLASLESGPAAVTELGNEFFDTPLAALGCGEVQAAQMPDSFRRLLVHNDHMTTTLGEYYGAPVGLQVLQFAHHEPYYSRKILLVLPPADTVVEFGIVRLDLSAMAREVRAQIVARDKPLGDILIEHDVLREIQPRWYFRFTHPSPALQSFGPPDIGEAYGRVGVIHYEGRPAIELLEIVRGSLDNKGRTSQVRD